MIDHYFEKPYWIVDILPEQVPADSPGQYFAAEQYYLREPQITAVRNRFADLLIKLNCYYDIRVHCRVRPEPAEKAYGGRLSRAGAGGFRGGTGEEEGWIRNPEPADLARKLQSLKSGRDLRGRADSLNILVEGVNSLLVLQAEETHLTVYNPTEGLLEKLRRLAHAEGLFVWKPEKNNLPQGEFV